MSFKQKLALAVYRAATMETGVTFPYGFEAYAKVAAATKGKRLHWDWR